MEGNCLEIFPFNLSFETKASDIRLTILPATWLFTIVQMTVALRLAIVVTDPENLLTFLKSG